MTDPWMIRAPLLVRESDGEGFHAESYPESLRTEILASAGSPGPELAIVTCDSPLHYKEAVEEIGRYFRRETGMGPAGYEVADCGTHSDRETRAFLFLDRSPEGAVAIGGGCFRWRNYPPPGPMWALQWVWLHPYARNGRGTHGGLGRAWPFFERAFGPFVVEPPVSPAMRTFLTRLDRSAVEVSTGQEVILYGSGGAEGQS